MGEIIFLAGLSPSTEEQSPGALPEQPYFNDLAADSRLIPYVRFLTEKGILKGFPDGSFRPQEGVTRAQAAKVAALVKGLPEGGDGPAFTDVRPDHWACGVIRTAAKAGLFSGYPDGSFNPEAIITRSEAVTLLLSLSGGALSDEKISIADMGTDHWAYRQAATAVKAGIVVLSEDGSFKPDQPFRRGDLATGLGAVMTLGPALRQAELTGRLIVKSGKVTVTNGSGELLTVTPGMPVGAGVNISTGQSSQAELSFSDGSGILMEENTEISVTTARGFLYMRQDGSPGVTVDKLALKMKTGKIFGALASRYMRKNNTDEKNTTSLEGFKKKVLFLASNKLPTVLNGILAATAGQDEESPEGPWWAETNRERHRVVVDMPFHVAGIRGTFWMNEVSSSGQRTAVIIGHADVTSSGGTGPCR